MSENTDTPQDNAGRVAKLRNTLNIPMGGFRPGAPPASVPKAVSNEENGNPENSGMNSENNNGEVELRKSPGPPPLRAGEGGPARQGPPPRHAPPPLTSSSGPPPISGSAGPPPVRQGPPPLHTPSTGPPPLHTPSTGPPPLHTSSTGPPPLKTPSSGPPPLHTPSSGPPPLKTPSSGPPPLQTPSSGPPPLKPSGGPPPLKPTATGPPPLHIHAIGSIPSKPSGPPPLASNSNTDNSTTPVASKNGPPPLTNMLSPSTGPPPLKTPSTGPPPLHTPSTGPPPLKTPPPQGNTTTTTKPGPPPLHMNGTTPTTTTTTTPSNNNNTSIHNNTPSSITSSSKPAPPPVVPSQTHNTVHDNNMNNNVNEPHPPTPSKSNGPPPLPRLPQPVQDDIHEVQRTRGLSHLIIETEADLSSLVSDLPTPQAQFTMDIPDITQLEKSYSSTHNRRESISLSPDANLIANAPLDDMVVQDNEEDMSDQERPLPDIPSPTNPRNKPIIPLKKNMYPSTVETPTKVENRNDTSMNNTSTSTTLMMNHPKDVQTKQTSIETKENITSTNTSNTSTPVTKTQPIQLNTSINRRGSLPLLSNTKSHERQKSPRRSPRSGANNGNIGFLAANLANNMQMRTPRGSVSNSNASPRSSVHTPSQTSISGPRGSVSSNASTCSQPIQENAENVLEQGKLTVFKKTKMVMKRGTKSKDTVQFATFTPPPVEKDPVPTPAPTPVPVEEALLTPSMPEDTTMIISDEEEAQVFKQQQAPRLSTFEEPLVVNPTSLQALHVQVGLAKAAQQPTPQASSSHYKYFEADFTPAKPVRTDNQVLLCGPIGYSVDKKAFKCYFGVVYRDRLELHTNNTTVSKPKITISLSNLLVTSQEDISAPASSVIYLIPAKADAIYLRAEKLMTVIASDIIACRDDLFMPDLPLIHRAWQLLLRGRSEYAEYLLRSDKNLDMRILQYFDAQARQEVAFKQTNMYCPVYLKSALVTLCPHTVQLCADGNCRLVIDCSSAPWSSASLNTLVNFLADSDMTPFVAIRWGPQTMDVSDVSNILNALTHNKMNQMQEMVLTGASWLHTLEAPKLIAKIFNSDKLTHLTNIHLSDSQLSSECIVNIAKECNEAAMECKSIDFSRNNIGDEGIIALASILKKSTSLSRTLTSLDLSDNQFTSVGLKNLAEWITAPKVRANEPFLAQNATFPYRSLALEKLYLKNLPIDDQGIRTLSKALYFSVTIKTLDLSGCDQFTHEGTKYLTTLAQVNESLTTLHFLFYKLQEQGLNALRLIFRFGIADATIYDDALAKQTQGFTDVALVSNYPL